jgi:uncharacterized protein (TIGR02271 family)
MKTLVGVFDSGSDAQRVKESLIAAGIDSNGISIQSSQSSGLASATQSEGGGVSGFFRRLFGADEPQSDELSSVYSEAIRRGSCIVSADVDSDEQAARAETIMHQAGAVDIDERVASWRASGWSGATGLSGGDLSADQKGFSGKQTIPVVEEEMTVGKRQVQRGRVRVFTRVTERPVEESVNLREEHATIERRPVDRPASEADMAAAMKGGSVEIRETSEEAVVGKKARVVEEVEIGKESSERTETVRDTVRETHVDVEQSADADLDKEALDKDAGRTTRRRPSGQQPRT